MTNIEAQHDSALRELRAKQQAKLDEFQKSQATGDVGVVYHYTNDVGLYAILQSGELWMSDYATLNDPSEIQYGIDAGVAALKDQWNTLGKTPVATLFVENFEAVAAKGPSALFRAYVLSMSVARDELTQWRSYGNNGGGYCPAFYSGLLDQAFKSFTSQHSSAFGSFLVRYDVAELRQLMDYFVGNAFAVILGLTPASQAQTVTTLKAVSVDLLSAFIYVALHFKHPAYKSEQEYRYVITTQPTRRLQGLHQRARAHTLIDYLRLDWKQSQPHALHSITVGPTVDFLRAQKFIKKTLLLHGTRNAAIVTPKSDIPYRG